MRFASRTFHRKSTRTSSRRFRVRRQRRQRTRRISRLRILRGGNANPFSQAVEEQPILTKTENLGAMKDPVSTL